jgi:anaphase-promoting complex subunit 8
MISPKEFIASKLRSSVQQCQLRGLFSAATWASEQLMGLDDDHTVSSTPTGNNQHDDTFVDLNVSEEKVNVKEIGSIFLGSSLMATGQYQRCAHNLRSEGNRKIQSNLGIFLYAYSQYLAGEKVRIQTKEEKEKKEKGKFQSKGRKSDNCDKVEEGSINPYVQQLHGYLESVYKNGQMDSYLLYIFAVVTRDLHKQVGKPVTVAIEHESEGKTNDPLSLFKASLAHNPWIW